MTFHLLSHVSENSVSNMDGKNVRANSCKSVIVNTGRFALRREGNRCTCRCFQERDYMSMSDRGLLVPNFHHNIVLSIKLRDFHIFDPPREDPISSL